MILTVTEEQYDVLSNALEELIMERGERRKKLVQQVFLAEHGWEIQRDALNREELLEVETDYREARKLLVLLEMQAVDQDDTIAIATLRPSLPIIDVVENNGVYAPQAA
jgi:hypothetical protein